MDLVGFNGPNADDRLLINHVGQLGVNRPVGFRGPIELQWTR